MCSKSLTDCVMGDEGVTALLVLDSYPGPGRNALVVVTHQPLIKFVTVPIIG